jgi:hypothetical protein
MVSAEFANTALEMTSVVADMPLADTNKLASAELVAVGEPSLFRVIVPYAVCIVCDFFSCVRQLLIEPKHFLIRLL